MADWKETLEPYIKVQESVKTVALNPTAGESLIVGVVLVSDSGSCTPTLITGQKEFKDLYASQDITKEYIESLDDLYDGASGMWANAYKLAGSTTLLVSRASKGDGIYFAKPLNGDSNNASFVLKDDEILRKVSGGFDISINKNRDSAIAVETDGWAVAVEGAGVYGNLVDDNGPRYDYFCNSLPELIDLLNQSGKFLVTDCTYYDCDDRTQLLDENIVDVTSNPALKNEVDAVYLKDVYVASNAIDKTDDKLVELGFMKGVANLTFATHGTNDVSQSEITDLNSLCDFESFGCYAINKYNSKNTLRVRIRKFNHTAVVNKEIGTVSTLTANGQSPYEVLPSVLNTLTKDGMNEANDSVKKYDFYEIAVYDPKASENVLFFNVGEITGRGDMTLEEVNEMLPMIYLNIPDMDMLGLNYYGYAKDDFKIVESDDDDMKELIAAAKANPGTKTETNESGETITVPRTAKEAIQNIAGLIYVEKKKSLYSSAVNAGNLKLYCAEDDTLYEVEDAGSNNQYFADITVGDDDKSLIMVNDNDLMNAAQLIAEDVVYTTEGLCDLGNTSKIFQNYLINMAINENYFYPISTINSTNYMTIANNVSKISQDSYKLYCSSPWDIDTGTLGWKFYASPAVLYWETVSRNRRNNEEFRPVFGQLAIGYQSPTTEFNKKTRQLLLSRRINTVMWDTQTQAWNMNDNYTKQNADNIMSDESNSRLAVRIAKATPVLLRQFIGKKITEKLCKTVKETIEAWIISDILPMGYTIEASKVKCDYDAALARKNKIKVVVAVRFSRALKYIDVYNNYFDTGMELSVEE